MSHQLYISCFKRILDIIISLSIIFLLSPLLILIAFFVKITSKGPCLYWSIRAGADNQPFRMPKFRSMINSAPILPTYVMQKPEHYLTPIGDFLRKSSLDELPQLWSVLKGDMTLVGPRPVLMDEKELIFARQQYGIDQCIPGLTGWAQVNGRDELSIPEKVSYEVEYLKKSSFRFDCYILWLTVIKVCKREGISH